MDAIPTDARSLGTRAGFSFIEILIVMGIIAVLSGLVVVAIQMVAKKKPAFESETRVQKMSAAAEAVRLKWGGTYPPATLTALEAVAGGGGSIKKVQNRTNEGIEALYQAIYWPGTGVDPQLGEGELVNTDEDQLEKPVGRGRDLWEVKDGYGNPIAYFPHTEYASAKEKPQTYVLGSGDTVDVQPWSTSNGFENPTSCQVFSFGPDGAPNTEDDIKGW